MPASRKPRHAADIASEHRQEIIAILATGLARLVDASSAPDAPLATRATISDKNLAESAKTGLELSRETRLSGAG